MYEDENIEANFDNIFKKYTYKEKEIFSNLLGIFVNAMDKEVSKGKFTDIAGKIFHLLELGNKRTGQFFTPSNLGYLVANTISEDDIKHCIEKQGYIYVNEPACGAGSIILGLATLLIELGYNPQTQLLIEATDIDRRCADMCFTQLGYYGLSAIVVHGDALSKKEWKRLYTPVYMMNFWNFRRR